MHRRDLFICLFFTSTDFSEMTDKYDGALRLSGHIVETDTVRRFKVRRKLVYKSACVDVSYLSVYVKSVLRSHAESGLFAPTSALRRRTPESDRSRVNCFVLSPINTTKADKKKKTIEGGSRRKIKIREKQSTFRSWWNVR